MRGEYDVLIALGTLGLVLVIFAVAVYLVWRK